MSRRQASPVLSKRATVHPDWVRVALMSAAAVFSAVLLLSVIQHYITHEVYTLWPDQGCQAYYAWRVAQGDVLYRDLWEPHPPGIIVLSALFHLALPNGTPAVKTILLALSFGIGLIGFDALRRFCKAPILVCLAGLAGAMYLHSLFLLALRPEALLALCTLATVHFTLVALVKKRPRWLALAGLAAGAGFLSKPGAVAALGTAVLLIVAAEGKLLSRRLAYFLGGAASLPVLWLGYLTVTGSLAPAWDAIVVYGRYYFPPWSSSLIRTYFVLAFATPWKVWLVLSYAFVMCFSPLWSERARGLFQSFRYPRVAWTMLFGGWLLLELLIIVPQSTLHQYIFDNFDTVLIYLLPVCVWFLFRRVEAPMVEAPKMEHWRGFLAFAVICELSAWLSLYLGQPDNLATTASFAGAVGGVLGFLLMRKRIPKAEAPLTAVSLAAFVFLAPLHMAIPGIVPYVFTDPNLHLRRGFNQSGPEEPFGRKLAELRNKAGGKLLAFTPSPSMAYLAQWPLALRYHVGGPLYLPEYCRLHDCWQEVLDVLNSGQVHIVMDWPAWYNIRNPEATPPLKYTEVVQTIASRFRMAAIVQVPYGAPVRIFADAGARTAARAIFGESLDGADYIARKMPHIRLGVVADGRWRFAGAGGAADGSPGEEILRYGAQGDWPLLGQWAPRAGPCPALFRSGSWRFPLNCNAPQTALARTSDCGGAADTPIVGDWKGSGIPQIGVFSNGWWRLDVDGDGQCSAGERTWQFGQPGDLPFAGKWRHPDRDCAGVFRKGVWYLDSDCSGQFDSGDEIVEQFGVAGDLPVVGDWNGDGRDDIGVFQQGTWILDANANRQMDAADFVFDFGQAGDRPVTSRVRSQ